LIDVNGDGYYYKPLNSTDWTCLNAGLRAFIAFEIKCLNSRRCTQINKLIAHIS